MKMSSTPSEFLRSRVIRHCAVAPALVAVGLAASYPAVADIFLKLDGTPGGSTNAFHRNEIDVSTYSQAFANDFVLGSGSGGAPKSTCGAITVLKNIDKASALLIRDVILGRHIQSGRITFQNSQAQAYYTVDMHDVVVTKIEQTDRTPTGIVMESVTLTPAQFNFTFRAINPDGTLGQALIFGYDCLAGTPL
jgi:type VI secretion system secreted protein Hcp